MYKIRFSRSLDHAGECDHSREEIVISLKYNRALQVQCLIHEILHEFSNHQNQINLYSESDIQFLSTFIHDRLNAAFEMRRRTKRRP